jgi:hypothetical protein
MFHAFIMLVVIGSYLLYAQCFKPYLAVDAYLWSMKLGVGSSLLAACILILDAFALYFGD